MTIEQTTSQIPPELPDVLFGVPIESFDERCRRCPVLASAAIRYAVVKDELESSTGRNGVHSTNSEMRYLERKVFPRMDNTCPNGVRVLIDEDGLETVLCGSKLEQKSLNE